MSNYLKYRIPYNLINEALKSYKNLVIFLDLNSIARGFYNRDVILSELNNYVESKQLPTLLIKELKEFLNNLHSSYKQFNPKFCIFYDLGFNEQNKSVSNSYKINRTNETKTYLIDDEERALYYQIKQYYFEEINKQFNIKGLCKVVFLDKYESDFVPFYFINKYDFTKDPNTMNLILSVDKDLLQCCQLPNTYQAISVYLKSESRIESVLYNDVNAVKYLSKTFQPDNFITSKYVPLILALAGDKSDGIDGIKKGLGFVSVIKMIKLYNLPPDFNSTQTLPNDISPYKLNIQTNLSLTSFERQISRIPQQVLDTI
jgi:5'-3' exonuclease